jgi:hypothetical protein
MGLLTNILEGKYDADLERIVEAVQQRRRHIGMINLATFQPGDRVKFKDAGVRPTYLQGVEATVITKRNTRLTVRLDQPVGRFRSNIIAFPQSLELVKKGGKAQD